MLSTRELTILSGNANPELAQLVANHLGVKLGSTKVTRFAVESMLKSKKIFAVMMYFWFSQLVLRPMITSWNC